MIPRASNGSDGDGSASNDKLISNALAWLNVTTVPDYEKDIVVVLLQKKHLDDKLQIVSNK